MKTIHLDEPGNLICREKGSKLFFERQAYSSLVIVVILEVPVILVCYICIILVILVILVSHVILVFLFF